MLLNFTLSEEIPQEKLPSFLVSNVITMKFQMLLPGEVTGLTLIRFLIEADHARFCKIKMWVSCTVFASAFLPQKTIKRKIVLVLESLRIITQH